MATNTTTLIQRFTFAKGERWFAFREMGNAGNWLPGAAEGATFAKLLGTGNGSGFSSWPDFSTYILISSWETMTQREAYFSGALFTQYKNKAAAVTEIEVRAIQSHGSWHGENPFPNGTSTSLSPESAILVLTRARIRFKRLLSFWRRVPNVAKQMTEAHGLLFAKGVGELPLVEQATISLWKNLTALNQAAYQRTAHSGAVKDTRKYNWYSEELFARFEVLSISGAPLY